MKALDELREWTRNHTVNCSDNRIALVVIAEAIKTELAERYVALPLDAEGEPIHVGDVMESRGGTVFEVEEISLYSYGWRCDGHGRDKNGYECNAHISPSDLTHHRPPTVEDVLREFTDAILEWAGKSGTVAEVGFWSDVAAEYIAKLQLREG